MKLGRSSIRRRSMRHHATTQIVARIAHAGSVWMSSMERGLIPDTSSVTDLSKCIWLVMR